MSTGQVIEALTAIALRLPDVHEHIDGKGTPDESREFETSTKTFLFLGKTALRLKLHESLEEAKKIAATSPDRYVIEADGWVRVTFGDKPPPIPMLRHWIGESHRLCGAKSA
jgi:hypothetical protein